MMIKDLRIINAICKKYNMLVDKTYKYITNDNNHDCETLYYKNKKYRLKYISGCFYPYIKEI